MMQAARPTACAKLLNAVVPPRQAILRTLLLLLNPFDNNMARERVAQRRWR
jgi:hypothetical protein